MFARQSRGAAVKLWRGLEQGPHDVRVVLFELAERLAQALKDQKEIEDAVSRLLNP